MPDPIPEPDPRDPSRLLRAWLPHIALFALTAGVIAWLVVVIWPALSSLLLAAALAALTYPVLFAPIDDACTRLLPRWNAADRRYLSALAATAALGAVAIGVVVVVLGSLIGSFQGTFHALLGLAMHDAHARAALVDLLVDRANQVAVLYPDLHVDLAALRQLTEHLLEQTAVGPAFFGYLISGTGGFLARSALTLVTLFYFYSQGPRLVEALMQWLPLTDEERRGLRQRFNDTARHLLSVTLARAIAHGLALTVLAWFIGGFHPVVVMVIATFIALLPVVGPAVIWLPLASLLWSQGEIGLACGLGAASLAATWLIERGFSRLARHLRNDDLWLGFLLFLGVVGGILGSGPLGIILGAGAVLTFTSVLGFLRTLYGGTEFDAPPASILIADAQQPSVAPPEGK
ncbi:MAG: AI-2E family transporter [Planctomycetes bacterium]|nr:AI-2E family transporter [Planctomycetota bacterium]